MLSSSVESTERVNDVMTTRYIFWNHVFSFDFFLHSVIAGNAYLTVFFNGGQKSGILKQCLGAYSQAVRHRVVGRGGGGGGAGEKENGAVTVKMSISRKWTVQH